MIFIFKCKDGIDIFKRSVPEGGLGFGIIRKRREACASGYIWVRLLNKCMPITIGDNGQLTVLPN